MKKVIGLLLVIALIGALSASLFACSSTPRDEILKIYMPGDYIDEDMVADFESWYLEKTGKKVSVQIELFDKVEDIQRSVQQGKADYDLLCPSDYMVEYLIREKLLKKVDKEIIDVEEEGLFREQYLDTSREFDPNLEYAVPYMYGTLGLVYDIRKTGKQITSWSDLFGSHNYKVSIKDSPRDAYAAVCLYNARESLAGLTGDAQKSAVQAVFEDTTTETVMAAKNTLKGIPVGTVWDSDDVKFAMANNTSNVAVALMWSCDAGYVMNDYEDSNGRMQTGNRNLWYMVPEEGGNVYIDCFVISKYAKNELAANYFLKYICEEEVAIANSEYAGAISPVKAAYDALYEDYTDPENEMLAEADPAWREMFLETMFPSDSTLNRCGVMKDFGDGQSNVDKMWSAVKGG